MIALSTEESSSITASYCSSKETVYKESTMEQFNSLVFIRSSLTNINEDNMMVNLGSSPRHSSY